MSHPQEPSGRLKLCVCEKEGPHPGHMRQRRKGEGRRLSPLSLSSLLSLLSPLSPLWRKCIDDGSRAHIGLKGEKGTLEEGGRERSLMMRIPCDHR